MKKLLASTALVMAFASPALAQEQFLAERDPTAMRASELIGMRIYAADAAVEGDAIEGVQDGWNDIGEINDLVVSRDGSVQAVLVDIGGFLGIGERQVAVDMGALQMVSDSATADVEDDFFFVLNAPRETLEGAPEYMWDDAAAPATEDADADETAGGDTTATGTAMNEVDTATTETDEAMTDETADAGTVEDPAATTQTDMAEGTATDRQPIVREGYEVVPAEMISAETLTGATVYDANDADIGEVSDIVLTAEGQVSHMVIDVGGFLGIGVKPVAVELSQADILQTADGSDLRVYVSMTEEQLEAMETFSR